MLAVPVHGTPQANNGLPWCSAGLTMNTAFKAEHHRSQAFYRLPFAFGFGDSKHFGIGNRRDEVESLR
jgi:hypothetical protein